MRPTIGARARGRRRADGRGVGVSTSASCEQLGAQAGRDFLVAEQPLEFAREVGRLMENPALWQEMVAQGRRFVQESCSWDVCGARVTEVVDRALKQPRSGMTSPVSTDGIRAIANP